MDGVFQVCPCELWWSWTYDLKMSMRVTLAKRNFTLNMNFLRFSSLQFDGVQCAMGMRNVGRNRDPFCRGS